MLEKVTAEEAKEVQLVKPVIGQMLTVISCETGAEIEIQLSDVYKYLKNDYQVSGDVITEQKYISPDGQEETIEVDDYFEAISAYGKYWSVYEPQNMTGDDSNSIRVLIGHEEVAVISKTEGVVDYERTR